MRTWRVGTVSMGASLVFLGVLLLFSKMLGLEIYPIMASWWPIILIVLGVEILIFFFLNQNEKTSVKYDIFSILFIGFIGTVGIVFALLSSLGIADEVSAAISSQEETRDLPSFEQQLPNSIERIVIETGNHPLVVEGTNSSEYAIFGQYRTQVSAQDQQVLETANDYLSTHQKGDTLFVILKGLPQRHGWNSSYLSMSVTMLIPSNMDVEIRGAQDVELRPRTINADYLIDQASYVSVYLPIDSDVVLQTTNVQELLETNLEWELTNGNDEKDELTSTSTNAQIIVGNGKNKISILNSTSISVYKKN
ncbi:hypothetical protein RJD24_09455 [Bacillaceae bacterium IKA-2]|nr:hypothetical protein RJD24_09455 [Bacillaceae bacterium IKA-2]